MRPDGAGYGIPPGRSQLVCTGGASGHGSATLSIDAQQPQLTVCDVGIAFAPTDRGILTARAIVPAPLYLRFELINNEAGHELDACKRAKRFACEEPSPQD